MNYFYHNKDGISFIWVLILVVVVGTLTAALLSASTHNIRFGVSETDTNAAFYAAEAGVQHMMGFPAENLPEIGEYFSRTLVYNSENYQVEYDIKRVDDNIYRSTGRVNDEVEQIIEFNLERDALNEVAALIKKGDIDDLDEYINLRGAEKEFSKDNLALIDIEDWWEYFKIHFGTLEGNGLDSDNYLIKDEDYFDDDFWNNHDLYDTDESEDDFWKIKEMERIGDREEDISGKRWYFTPYLVEAGEDVGNYELWDENERYTGNARVYYYDENKEEYRFFELKSNLPNDPPDDKNIYPEPHNYEEYWQENFYTQEEIKEFISRDDEYSFDSNMVIENSIIAVEGSLKLLGNITFKNSLILVKNNVEFGGNFDLDQSLIVAFNEGGADEDALVTTGNPSIGLNLIRRDSYKNWPGIEEVFANMDPDYFINAVTNWRQVR